MAKTTAAITGVAGFVPPYVLTNAELETMVDTNDEWIRTRTGIKERRILKGEGKATSDMGVEALKELMRKTGTKPEEIELLICATVTADRIFPDTANTILDKAGVKNAWGFDINAACSGFLFAITTGAQFIESGMHKKVVVVGADMMSTIVDYTDRTTCVIFGDGAGAVMLEPDEKGFGILDASLKGDGSGRQYLHMKAGGSLMPPSKETVEKKMHFVYQEGKAVFKNAIMGMHQVVSELMARNHLDNESLEWLVPHQANMRIITSLAETMKFPLEKVMINIEKYGNTTAATIPLCLWEWEDKLKRGDDVILTAFGGGFTWGAVYLKWAYGG